METKDNPKEQLYSINSNNKFKELKSDFFLKKFFNIIIPKRISLEIVKYNKYIQKRIDININDYKDYSEKYSSIEIEIIPNKYKDGKFINIKDEEIDYYHIYFDNNKREEINTTYLCKNDNVSRIKIVIDYPVKSFEKLFKNCEFIESTNFKKFYGNNITDMSFFFFGCSSLKELNLTNFNTNNVTDMSYMFDRCSDELKLKIIKEYKNFENSAFWEQ